MAPPGNQAVNGENKHQPDVSGETGLLNSNKEIQSFRNWPGSKKMPEQIAWCPCHHSGYTMMIYNGPLFKNRIDAGRQLAESLEHDQGSLAVVFAIPRGGIPVTIEVAEKLGSKLDVIVARKIPISDNPEAGYGAVTEDGVIVLNDALVRQLRFTRQQIERHAEEFMSAQMAVHPFFVQLFPEHGLFNQLARPL